MTPMLICSILIAHVCFQTGPTLTMSTASGWVSRKRGGCLNPSYLMGGGADDFCFKNMLIGKRNVKSGITDQPKTKFFMKGFFAQHNFTNEK